jgi:hypothetical protein
VAFVDGVAVHAVSSEFVTEYENELTYLVANVQSVASAPATPYDISRKFGVPQLVSYVRVSTVL